MESPRVGAVTVAFAVGQVQENSPAQQAGLEPYFDFIITIGHSRLVSSPTLPLLCLLVCVCVSPSVPQAPVYPSLPFFLKGVPALSPLLPGLYLEPDWGPAQCSASELSGVDRGQMASWRWPQAQGACLLGVRDIRALAKGQLRVGQHWNAVDPRGFLLAFSGRLRKVWQCLGEVGVPVATGLTLVCEPGPSTTLAHPHSDPAGDCCPLRPLPRLRPRLI